MEIFLNEVVEGEKFELLIDSNIFSKDIVLKAAYNFLDKGYFFFKFDENKNIIVQFTKKSDNKQDAKTVLLDFSDELLSVNLRSDLEISNKEIRERIVGAAIGNSLDINNFREINTDNNIENNQIDFDKDIDDILKEIENDPDLQINEEEIARILKEIEEESNSEEKPQIMINLEGVKKAKENISK
ncbi:MAG: His-Xaa-Ser system protein HxsD [Candidatus Gracilibacteria bacterium]|nr:His-Xaa-Ser system protein HxsD [Candidatus Gracilibacteria bacterium]